MMVFFLCGCKEAKLAMRDKQADTHLARMYDEDGNIRRISGVKPDIGINGTVYFEGATWGVPLDVVLNEFAKKINESAANEQD